MAGEAARTPLSWQEVRSLFWHKRRWNRPCGDLFSVRHDGRESSRSTLGMSAADDHGAGGILSAGLVLFTAAAGAGLLSFPFAFMQSGAVLCTLLTALFAFGNLLSDAVLVQTCSLFSSTLRARTYEELCYRALGVRAYLLAVASILVGTLGGLVGFAIVLGDLSIPVAEHLAGCSGAACPWWLGRPFITLFFAIVVVLPLSSLKRMHGLAWSSALATLSVLAVGGVILQHGAARWEGAAVEAFATSAPDSSSAGALEAPLVLVRLQAGVLLGVPICVFSLGHNCQVVPVFAELGAPAQRRFGLAALSAVGACWLLYCATGAAGYLAWRDATRGDALLNMAPGEPAADAAKALLALHVLLPYPVLLWPARESLATLLRRAGMGAGEGGADGASSTAAPRRARAALALAASPLAQSSLLVLGTAGAAIAAPQVALVFGLAGATTATLGIYLLPGALLWRWARAAEAGRAGEAGAGAGEGAGEGAGASARADSAPLLPRAPLDCTPARAAFQPYADGWCEEDAAAVWAQAAARCAPGSAAPLTAQLLPRGARPLRALAVAMLATGGAVAVGGTGVFVWSTWLQRVG